MRRMRKTHINLILFILFEFVFNNGALAWNEAVTHQDLSEYAAESSVLDKNKGDYLRNIGFFDALNTKVKWVEEKSIRKWLRAGAMLEDKSSALFPLFGTTRSFNHFHNPLKDWAHAGLNDMWTGESSLLWAQEGIYQSIFPEGNWSWQKIRDYYHLALTSTADAARQEYFAMTFRGLGHQMHLLQDTAVPDHVRNDAHPEDAMFGKKPFTGTPYFESWAKNNPGFINSWAENPVFPNVSFNIPYNGYVPVTQLFDAEQYTGANPSTSLTQGLSEYTNANFYSNDTIFAAERYQTSDPHYFSYPKKTSTDLQGYIAGTKDPETIIGDDGQSDTAVWISKTTVDGESINHFLRAGFLSKYIYALDGEGDNFYRSFFRDVQCHEDYASKLIPRAVGYSAGLLDYFFRGDLEITSEPNGIKIKNTYQEVMESYTDSTGSRIGNIGIYYDDVNNSRHLLATYELTSSLSPAQETPVIPFTAPSDNIKAGKYILIFRGKLGSEEGAVIGKVVNTMAYIYYTSARGGIEKLYKIGTDGSNPTVLYDNQNPGIYIRGVRPSPDGKTLAFVVYDSAEDITGAIYLMDLTTGAVNALTSGDSFDWSPDGKKIVFEREGGECLPYYADDETFIHDLTTAIETQITERSCSPSVHPIWSPDGSMIAYSRWQDAGERNGSCSNFAVIYLMSPSGNPIGPITCGNDGYEDFVPSWSPDGSEIIFIRKAFTPPQNYYQLYKVNILTGAITKLTDSNGTNFDESVPAWSPDGKTIAIGSGRDGDYDIWLVDPNAGGYKTNLTDANPEYDIQPSFSK